MSPRPTRFLAITALLATGALLPLPLAAAERPDAGTATPSVASTAPTDGPVLVTAQNDVMVPDDEDETEASGGSGHDRWSRAASDDDGQRGDRGWDRRGRDGRGWDQAQDGHRPRGEDSGRGGWDDDRSDHGARDDNSLERRRMMAMHGRMMQALQAQRQPAAGFRLEIGNTRMAVRCSPRETMRECVDAALSLVNRLRDADKPRATVGPDSNAPSPSGTPGSPPSSAAPGSGSGSPQ